MKKRLIAFAGGAAVLAAAAIPAGSAFGLISNSKQCSQLNKAGFNVFVVQGTPNSQTEQARDMQFSRANSAANCFC